LLGNVPETAPFPGLGGLQGRLTVWPGTGGFGLGLPGHFPAGPDPASITFADFDQGSQMDVAFGNALGGHLTVPVNATVLFGTGGGSFGPPVKVGEEGGAHRMAGGDFDGDGLIDLACIEHGIWPDGGVLFRSDGTGSFERIGYAAPQPNLVLAADFEGDGRLDLVSHGIGHGIFGADPRPPAPTSCAGTTTNYGAGCAAASGFFPTLSAYGCPTAGNTVELELLGAPSPAVNFFLLSVATTNLPMGYGCNLLVAPPFVAAPVAKAAGLYAATVAHLPVPLGTPPVTVHVQAFVTIILVEVGFANSNGVTLTNP